MKINVLCEEVIFEWGADYRPVDSWEKKHGHVSGKLVYKTFHINQSRIVVFNPNMNAVAIDDGTSDGISYLVDSESAKEIIFYLLDHRG